MVTRGDEGATDNVADAVDRAEVARVSRRAAAERQALYERHERELGLVWEEYDQNLPAEGRTQWPCAAAYVRESSIGSLAAQSPANQLYQVLRLLRNGGFYVARDAIYFELASATSVSGRRVFSRVLDEALSGRYVAIGAFLSDRLFRNAKESEQIETRFRRKGIEFKWLGKIEGDEDRDPNIYLARQNERTMNEAHSRRVAQHVGTALEEYTRRGQPVGPLPEVFVVSQRDQPRNGHIGRPIAWGHNEPLASVVRDGAQRALANWSWAEIARWGTTVMTDGLTPNGSVMDAWWWRQMLTNPKLAGMHKPTSWMGFRPGEVADRRERRSRDSTLVPCALPALISVDDWRKICELSDKRRRGAKTRYTYRQYLLSGVAYDARCGHRLNVHSRHKSGSFTMGCITRNALGKHDFAPMPAHLAEAQLDALLSHLSFDNETLFSMIEDRLSELHQIARTGEKSFAPDPRVAETRAALFTIRDAPPEILAPLKDHLAALEAADGARRLSHRQPVIDFRRAVDELKEWKRLWGDSDIAARNELLKAGGLRVVIGRPDGRTRGAAEILSVSASHPGFTLALAVALSKWTVALELPTGHERRNAISFFGLEGHWGQVLAEMPDPDLTLMVPSPLRKRPTKTAPIVAFPPVSSTEPTVSVREAAGMIGIKPVTGYVWVSLGWLPMIRVNGVMRIPVSAIEPAAVAHPRFRRKAA